MYHPRFAPHPAPQLNGHAVYNLSIRPGQNLEPAHVREGVEVIVRGARADVLFKPCDNTGGGLG